VPVASDGFTMIVANVLEKLASIMV